MFTQTSSSRIAPHSNERAHRRGDLADKRLAAEYTPDKFTQVANLGALMRSLAGQGVLELPLANTEERSSYEDKATVEELNAKLQSGLGYEPAFCKILNSIPSAQDRQFSAIFAKKALKSSQLCTKLTQPDIVGYQGHVIETYTHALFVGELTCAEVPALSGRIAYAEQNAKPVIKVWREKNEYLQTLHTCSDILRHRPFSPAIFAFLFTRDIFTFFAYTREGIIFFEVIDWHKGRYKDVMDAMRFLVQLPLDGLIGRPTFETRPSHENFTNLLEQCRDLNNLTWSIIAHHNRNFGRSTAVYGTDTPGQRNKIIKIAHLAIRHHKRSEDPVNDSPVPVEILVMQHLNDQFDHSAEPHLQEFKSRFPRLEAWAVAPRRMYPLEQTEGPPKDTERELCAILMSGAGHCIGRKSIKGVLSMFEFLIDFFETMQALNGLGVMHGDISPGNVLVRISDDEDPDFPKCLFIDFDSSTLVDPGPKGIVRPMKSWWNMDGPSSKKPITATPSCVAYAVAKAGLSSEYYSHSRQDCESGFYFALEFCNELLLSRSLFRVLEAPSVDNRTETFQSSQQPKLSHREDNLKKFDEMMEALNFRSKGKAQPKSYDIVIRFIVKLKMSHILPGLAEQSFWALVAQGREPVDVSQKLVRAEDENWLLALQEVIQLLKNTLKELRDCGESLNTWEDWDASKQDSIASEQK